MTRSRPTDSGDSWREVAAHLREGARVRAQVPPERVLLAREVQRLAGRLQGRRVLDVACGTGALARLLAADGAEVFGIDVSPAAVHTADHETKEAGVVNAPQFAVGDLLSPATLPAGPFDVVTCVLALHESADPLRALRAIAKLLHPRGRLVVAIEHFWPPPERAARGPFGSLAALLAVLREAGLRLVDAAEPDFAPGASHARHLVFSAERTSKRPRNRGTSR